MGVQPDEFWRRVERSAALYSEDPLATAASAPSISAEEKEKKKKYRTRLRRVLDLIAVTFWVYVVVKLFVADIDESIFGQLADYRLVAFLGVAIVLSAFFSSLGAVAFAYVIFFPFVLVCWKLPWFLYRRKSWLPVIAAANIGISMWGGIRWRIATVGAFILWAFVIVADMRWAFSLVAVVGLGLVLVIWHYWTLRSALRPARGLAKQNEVVRKIVGSDAVRKVSAEGHKMMETDLETYSRASIEQFGNQLGLSLLLNRGLYFWSYQLHRYRRSLAIMLTTLTQYLFLFIASSMTGTLINTALLRHDPSQYTATPSSPSIMRIALFSITSLFWNASAGIEAVGDGATFVRIAAGFLGSIVGLTLFASLALAYRAGQGAQQSEAGIRDLQKQADEQAEYLRTTFAVSVDEAFEKLVVLNRAMSGLVRFVVQQVPDEFLRPSGDDLG